MASRIFQLISTLTITLSVLFHMNVSVQAHEYWLEPLEFAPAMNEEIEANIIVGQDFKGNKLAFVPQFAVVYQVHDEQGIFEPSGNAGDRPAIQVQPRGSGLNIIAYQSTKNRLDFDDFEFFKDYLSLEGLDEIAQIHLDRGLPQTGFSERYSRFVKTLLNVGGTGEGQDRPTGLRAELVALTNPYALDAGDQMQVQVLWEGKPEKNVQVKIFAQSPDQPEPEITLLRTNQAGIVSFPLAANSKYLLNNVHMEPEEFGEDKIAWQSYWASITFFSN